MQDDLVIDPEFAALLPGLSSEERIQLEANIVAAGRAHDAIVCWGLVIVDGHNRYEICKRLDLPYDVRQVEFADREAVKLWMVQNQLGKRNLSAEKISYFRGKEYDMGKGKKGGDRKSEKSKGQNVPLISGDGDIAEKLAKKHGVSAKTIKRDAEYAAAVDKLEAELPGSRDKALSGEISKSEVLEQTGHKPAKEAEPVALPERTVPAGYGFTDAERAKYDDAALKAGMGLWGWIRTACDAMIESSKVKKPDIKPADKQKKSKGAKELCARCKRFGVPGCAACRALFAESVADNFDYEKYEDDVA